MEKQHSIQFQRTRKFLLVLPLLVLPFLTLAFYALGGGKAHSTSSGITQIQGLNPNLPAAKFDPHEKPGDKMSFYDQVKQDSDRLHTTANNSLLQQFGFRQDSNISTHSRALGMTHTAIAAAYTDPNVEKINQKLFAIKKEISEPPKKSFVMPASQPEVPASDNKAFAAQVDKLETMMKAVTAKQDTDPQIAQLTKVLNQIQAIQHPEQALAGIKTDTTKRDTAFRTIPAVIDGKQKVLQGGTVRLKLADSIRIRGIFIPKGQLIFGTANIINQRLLLDFRNIRIGKDIIPVDFTVYSLDGMPGIFAPDAELAGAAGTGADNALQSMQFLSMDQSLATQAAAGGIQAAKGLFSKKIKKIKVKLKDGYPLLLRNNKH